MDCGRGLCGDFVLDGVSADEVTGQVATGPRRTRRPDTHLGADFLADFGEPAANRLQRLAGGGQVASGNYVRVVVDQHHVGR